jgi:carbon-monoxide dehydrogenase medium subunit
MNNFDYAAPTSLAEATALLAQPGRTARILAGGTDILVQLREHLKDAELVVDVKKIPELTALTYSPAQGLSLGASVPCYRIYEHDEVPSAYPALADAARIVGGWQIQSRASVGGNLCNASPAADTIPPLIALKATCRIAGPGGIRQVPAEAFCTAPGRSVLQPGEILVTMVLPPPHEKCGSAYERFIPRNEMDIAVAGTGSWIRLSANGDTIEEARVALAAVAPTPLFAHEASQWLAGKPATEETFAQAGELARAIARPISDLRGTAEFRRHLVAVLVARTLARAALRARGR